MAEADPLRVLIADDEPLAAERLQLLLARADGAQLVGTASDGDSAINLTEALHPDLLLLDIAMPGLDGIGVARALAAQNPSPAVVFVTAFDQFAVAAFEVEAVDYLIKPVEPARLQRALDRTRAYLQQRSVQPAPGKAWESKSRECLSSARVSSSRQTERRASTPFTGRSDSRFASSGKSVKSTFSAASSALPSTSLRISPFRSALILSPERFSSR